MTFRLCLILILSWNVVTSAAEIIREFGYVGGSVTIRCPTPTGYESYEKYFCRNDCTHNDVLVTTSEGQRGRYRITNLSSFEVIISGLTTADAGKYWCGITRNGVDIYTEVRLQVKPDSCCDLVNKVQASEEGSASFSCQDEPGSTLKYLCKGSQPSVCLKNALVTSQRSKDSRISLSNDGSSGTFVATIQNVKRGDSGQYLCGIQRKTGPDVFQAFTLEVRDWCCVETSRGTATAGKPVTIQCRYSAPRVRRNFFVCKGERRDSCTDVAPLTRFNLSDTPTVGVFNILMTEVTMRDAGTYWCGAEPRWTAGTYTKYHLTVDVPQSTAAPTTQTTQQVLTTTTQTPATEFIPQLYIILPAVLVFLLIVVVVPLVWRCKCRKQKEVTMNAETDGKQDSDDNNYENVEAPNEVKKGPKLIHSLEDESNTVYQNVAVESVYCNASFYRNKPAKTSNWRRGQGQKDIEGYGMVRKNRK